MKSYAIYVWYDAIFNCISSSSCLALYRGSGIDVSGFQNAEIEMTRLISMKCCFFSSVDLLLSRHFLILTRVGEDALSLKFLEIFTGSTSTKQIMYAQMGHG
jgi:hypothetical protein